MKYKNISTEGTYKTMTRAGIREKLGKEKHFKINGKFTVVFPGETFECPVELNDPDMELVVEKKPKPKEKPKEKPVEKPAEDLLDLNKDGKVDKKDASIAAKVMNAIKNKGKKGKK